MTAPREAEANGVPASHAVVLLTNPDGFDCELIGRTSKDALDTRNRVSGPGVEHL